MRASLSAGAHTCGGNARVQFSLHGSAFFFGGWQVVALLGVHKVIHAEWPLLVPAHIVLYMIHLVQEQFDIWAGPAWFTVKPETKLKPKVQ